MSKYITAIAIAAVALMGTSCSTINKIIGRDSDTGTTITTRPVKPGEKQKKDKSSGKTSKTSEHNRKPTQDELCGGMWTVASVGETQIVAEDEAPYISFDRAGRFYASDGCNIINGDYALRSDGTLVLSQVLSTMKYCPDDYSALIASVFSGSTKLGADCRRIGQDTYLYLKGANGNVTMTLRRHNMEFLNGNWQVMSIDGMKVNDEEVNIFIDIAELKVHGNTGCNFFNGVIYIDPNRSNAIDFSDMGVTRKACPNSDRERMMLVALEEARTAISGKNDDTVLLLNKAGKELMTLKRIPLPNED